MRRNHRILAATAVFGLALALAGCDTDPDNDDDNGNGNTPPTGAPPAAPAGLQVVSPQDGDTVSLPFEVAVAAADVELGPINDELHHFHVWFGEDVANPIIIESDSGTVTDAPAGEVTMWVQVQTFEHQPVGDAVSLTVTVEGNGEGGDNPPNGGPYDY